MKNKLILLGFFALFIGFGAKADPITFESAKQTATRFYSVQIQPNGAKSLPDFTCVYPKNGKSVSAVPYYIFNAGENQGFVIVAGDDNARRLVLGYSDKGRFEMDNMPDNVHFWLDFYAHTMDLAAKSGIKAAEPADFSKAEVVKEPLLDKISYNQDAPYNELCPIDPNTGKRSYSGCVATALASVARYYQYPEKGQGSITYISNGQELSMDFSQNTYDWENILEAYNGSLSSYTQEQRTAIATLMRDMGYAVKMNYTSSASGAVRDNTVVGVVDYMGFDSIVNFRERDLYDNDDQWKAVLKENIDNGQPLYYSGYGDGGGHAFVCDGYNDADYFHFNWGWGGYCDGYFTVENLDPGHTEGIGAGTGGGYSSMQGILHNMVPPGHARLKDLYLITATHTIESDRMEDSVYSIAEDLIGVDFRGFKNTAMSAFNGVMALAAFKNGEFVKILSDQERVQIDRYASVSVAFTLRASLEDLEAGEYEIWTVCKSDVEDADWEKVYATKNSKYTNDSYIPVLIGENDYRLLKTTALLGIRIDIPISRNINMFIHSGQGVLLGSGMASSTQEKKFTFRYGDYELRFWTRGYDTSYVRLNISKDTSITVSMNEMMLPPYIRGVRVSGASATLLWRQEDPRGETAYPTGYIVYLDSVEVARVETSTLEYTYEALPVGLYYAGLRSSYINGESEMVNYSFRIRTDVADEKVMQAICRLSPNPSTTGYFTLEVAEECRLQVCDFSGKVLFGKDLALGSQQVDMNAYPAGVYLFRLIGRDGEAVTMKAVLKK